MGGRLTVSDDVHACQILASHKQQTNRDSVSRSLLEELLEHVLLAHSHRGSFFDLLSDICELGLDVFMIWAELSNIDQNLLGVLPAVLASEPSGRFWACHDADEEEQTW